MARKKKTEKKETERKVIREFVETRFKEIKPETEEISEVVEEKAEEKPDEESFIEFSSGSREALVLKAEAPVEEINLEKTAESVPSTARTEETAGNLYAAGSYEATYASNYETERPVETPLPSSFFSGEKKVQEMLPRRETTYPQGQASQERRIAETWQEIKEEERKYETIEKKASREEEKLRERRRRIKA